MNNKESIEFHNYIPKTPEDYNLNTLYIEFLDNLKSKYPGVTILDHEILSTYFCPMTIMDGKCTTHGPNFYNDDHPTHYHWLHKEIGMTDTAVDKYKEEVKIGDEICYVDEDSNIDKGEVVYIFKHHHLIYDGGDDTGLIYDTFAWDTDKTWYSILVINENKKVELITNQFIKKH